MTRQGEGYNYQRPFRYERYERREEVVRALSTSLEYLIAYNLSAIAAEYRDSNFSGYGFTEQQLHIIDGVYHGDILGESFNYRSLPSQQIYKEIEDLTYLNGSNTIPTARLPINGIAVGEPHLSVDIAARQRPEDLDSLALPFIHSLVTPIEIIWGPGRKPLSGELHQQVAHVITKPLTYMKKLIFHTASSSISLDQDSEEVLASTIQKLTSYKGSISTAEGRQSHTWNPGGVDRQIGGRTADDEDGNWE